MLTGNSHREREKWHDHMAQTIKKEELGSGVISMVWEQQQRAWNLLTSFIYKICRFFKGRTQHSDTKIDEMQNSLCYLYLQRKEGCQLGPHRG